MLQSSLAAKSAYKEPSCFSSQTSSAMVSLIRYSVLQAINSSMLGFASGILPKFFYLLLQLSFLVALVALNWEFLTTESDGIIVLILVVVLSLGTLIFYFLTGLTDPGFVRN